MKATIFTIVVVCVFAGSYAKLTCSHNVPPITDKWLDMVDPCTEKMKDQVQEELKAAIQYLAMGAHFSKDVVNRPGFAKMFFDAASEEREHAMKLISYLLMRGELTKHVSKLITMPIVPLTTTWENAASALTDALNLEATVTQKIRSVIEKCEGNSSKFNDYHLVDYLTGEFLEEQYKGQREIAGRLSTLQKMMEKHGALGEFLFDKKLLD